MDKQIYLDAPNVGEDEKILLNKAVDSGFVSTIGPFVNIFEDKFANYINTKKAVSTQSGTAAIHIALHELGIGVGDEVIVPALTFVASVNPIIYVNAIPVFVDIDIKTWNIDTSEIEKNITYRTKAILPVHLYGNPCDMDMIIQIAQKYNLYIIEDAAESLGAIFHGKYTGTFGNFGCFSFNGNKIITTGGGGMIVGNNEEQLAHIKFLVNQGRDESRGYYHPEIGFNYRMTNIEAAIGLAQLKKLNNFLEKKKQYLAIYHEELSTIKDINFQESHIDAKSSCWLTAISVDGISIKKLQFHLHENGIPTRDIFMPVVNFPPFKNYIKGVYKNSNHIYKTGLCLPSSTRNTEEGIIYVCKIIKKFFN